jgi:purine-nucleoside phosphorylase
MGFPGPTFPTRAEVRVCTDLNVPLAGITSLSGVYAATGSGLTSVALATVQSTLQGSTAQGSFSRVVGSPKLTACVERILSAFVMDTNSHTPKPIPSQPLSTPKKNKSQLTYELSRPVIQGSYEDVCQTEKWVKSQLGVGLSTSVTLALVVEDPLKPVIAKHLKVITSIPYKEIKEMSSIEGELVFGEFQGVPVYALLGTAYLNEGLPAHQITYGIRLLGTMGAQSLFFVGSFVSCDSSLGVHSLVLAKDHVLLSGRNPLFGKNEDRWGARFLDVSELYHPLLNKTIQQTAQSESISIKEIYYAHMVGPLFNSGVTGSYAKHFGMQAICTGMTQEIIVARHMNIAAAFLGIVTSVIQPQQEEQERGFNLTTEEQISHPLADLLAKVLKQIYKSTSEVPRGDAEQQLQHVFKKDHVTDPAK